MASEAVQQIKDKLDIVDFLRGYLEVTSAGRNFKARCPFHKEKTPSFMISPERQTWHCFGCGLGGDVFTFIMRHENIEFGEALKILADKTGVELRRMNPAEYKYFGLLYDINNAAKEFFRNELEGSETAKKYLKERGLAKETIHEFELGWAPNAPEALTLHLLNLGFSPDELIRAGVTFKTERGLQIDRFRGRIMFPIHNHLGKVVGFTGRVLPHEGPEHAEGQGNPSASSGFAIAKYVNSPESPIFQKSKLLYGFWKTKGTIRDSGAAFLVEGQMDFLMSWQAGIKNVVASSGTALTVEHLKALKRAAPEIVLSFDNDEAGWAAAERAIDLAEANDFNVKVATLAEFKDPAEAAQARPEYLIGAVSAARPALSVYFERYLSGGVLKRSSREGLVKLRIVLGKIKNISSPAEQVFWIRELANFTSLPEKVLSEEAEKVEVKRPASAALEAYAAEVGGSGIKLTRQDLIMTNILGTAVVRDDFSILDGLEMSEPSERAFEIMKDKKTKSDDPYVDEIISGASFNEYDRDEEVITDLRDQYNKEHFKNRRLELVSKLKQAEANGEDVVIIMEELRRLPLI